jgi:type II secretory pathway component HofQ
MRAATIAIIACAAGHALADDFCPRTGRGANVSLSVRQADVQDVLRVLARVGKKDLVVPDSVQGKLTLQLQDVPWDSAVCTVAALLSLRIEVNGTILLVTKR